MKKNVTRKNKSESKAFSVLCLMAGEKHRLLSRVLLHVCRGNIHKTYLRHSEQRLDTARGSVYTDRQGRKDGQNQVSCVCLIFKH